MLTDCRALFVDSGGGAEGRPDKEGQLKVWSIVAAALA
jgi:hypothetical protein